MKVQDTNEMETIKITLELPASSIQKIEQAADCSIKCLLQTEMSEQNVDAFVERMGWDNW
jgi:hypothetical protein